MNYSHRKAVYLAYLHTLFYKRKKNYLLHCGFIQKVKKVYKKHEDDICTKIC